MQPIASAPLKQFEQNKTTVSVRTFAAAAIFWLLSVIFTSLLAKGVYSDFWIWLCCQYGIVDCGRPSLTSLSGGLGRCTGHIYVPVSQFAVQTAGPIFLMIRTYFATIASTTFLLQFAKLVHVLVLPVQIGISYCSIQYAKFPVWTRLQHLAPYTRHLEHALLGPMHLHTWFCERISITR